MLEFRDIYNAAGLTAFVGEIGFLPLLNMGIRGWSAEEQVSDDCMYTRLPDGGFEWPLWDWKGSVIKESGCAYGKFFEGKAAFICREWWPDFCNWRRSRYPEPAENSIEDVILQTLATEGSMVTRDLRAACGFSGTKMRGKFDSYITRLQMACRIVTEDFVYPLDKHGHEYGWGFSLLTTPEQLFGREQCVSHDTPEESHARLVEHFKKILSNTDIKLIDRLLR